MASKKTTAETTRSSLDNTEWFRGALSDGSDNFKCHASSFGALGPTGATGPTGSAINAVTSAEITIIKKLTQAAYDALSPPVATTLYVIVG